MLYVQNFNCSFVSVIGEVKIIQKLTEANLEDSNYKTNLNMQHTDKIVNSRVVCQMPQFEASNDQRSQFSVH